MRNVLCVCVLCLTLGQVFAERDFEGEEFGANTLSFVNVQYSFFETREISVTMPIAYQGLSDFEREFRYLGVEGVSFSYDFDEKACSFSLANLYLSLHIFDTRFFSDEETQFRVYLPLIVGITLLRWRFDDDGGHWTPLAYLGADVRCRLWIAGTVGISGRININVRQAFSDSTEDTDFSMQLGVFYRW